MIAAIYSTSHCLFFRKNTMNTLPFASAVSTHIDIARSQAAESTSKSASTNSARTLGSVLLAASVSALLVVVNQALDAWSEDHLLIAWAALWAIGFLAIGLLATPAHQAARSLRTSFLEWRAQSKERALEAKLWELAHHDTRVMAEIYAAKLRQQG
jgi:hypothetical protein